MEVTTALVELFDAEEVEELVGGKQSRVFRVHHSEGPLVIAKVLNTDLVDRHELDVRVAVMNSLADLDPTVCRPLQVNGRLVTDLDLLNGHKVAAVCFEFAEGRPPDPFEPADAELMGRTLLQLHQSMSRIEAVPLPLVAALRTISADEAPLGGPHHLLHGDFHASNLRVANGAVKVFDFDDAGYGPPLFDVANALYLVMFEMFEESVSERNQPFRRSFLTGYFGSTLTPAVDAMLDVFIQIRVAALRNWLDDLASAPIGIRSSSPDWLAVLRSFVDQHPDCASST